MWLILIFLLFSTAHLDAMLRSLVIGRLGKAGHKPTVEEAKKRFAAHCDGSSTLPADLRNPVCYEY